MENIVKIISQLKNTSGANAKIEILKQNSNNELLKKVLKYTYSDDLNYGFSKSNLKTLLKKDAKVETWTNGFDMLDELNKSNINNELRDKVVSFLNVQTEEIKDLWIKMITKDLRCGVNSKSINKGIPSLIYIYEIQQANSIHDTKLKKDEWITVMLKLNGIRSSFLNGEFKSRQNKIMAGYDHIKNDLTTLKIDNYFVDGEFIRKNMGSVSDNENFRLTTSIVNSDSMDKSEIEFVIFDIITKEDFKNKESKLTFKDRLKILRTIEDDILVKGLENVRIAPVYYVGTDHSQIEIILDMLDNLGCEGVMCLRDAPYKCKRHSGILKCKKFKSADCKIIGYEEGEGNFQGMLGSFVIDYKGNKVNVGSGYQLEERVKFWENKDDYIGKILEVKFKDETKDKKTGLVSLQFPIFISIREDKTEESYE